MIAVFDLRECFAAACHSGPVLRRFWKLLDVVAGIQSVRSTGSSAQQAGGLMEDFGRFLHLGEVTLTSITELPDAVKFVKISGPIARQIADYALHTIDLEFVLEALKEINLTSSEFVKEALWELAIIKFIKCFGSSGRIQLNEKAVYRGKPGANEVFDYFKTLRNKHVVHDENSYTQCVPVAALNDGKKDFKVEKIVASSARGVTLEQANYANLHQLATDALEWVRQKFDTLCVSMTAELEKQPLETLNALPAATLELPAIEEIDRRRQREAVPRSDPDAAQKGGLALFEVPADHFADACILSVDQT